MNNEISEYEGCENDYDNSHGDTQGDTFTDDGADPGGDNYDDSMDGDFDSGMASAGWGTDESYDSFEGEGSDW